MVSNDVRGTPIPTLAEFLRQVPWATLVLATVVYEITVAIGLLFFVFPGLFVLVRGVLNGPVTVVEGGGAVRASKRSGQLVRGSFWPVALLVLVTAAIYEIVSVAVALALDGHHWARVLGEYTTQVFFAPMAGVGLAVLYYALVAREGSRLSA
jgi:uncharacterized membrane protein